MTIGVLKEVERYYRFGPFSSFATFVLSPIYEMKFQKCDSSIKLSSKIHCTILIKIIKIEFFLLLNSLKNE